LPPGAAEQAAPPDSQFPAGVLPQGPEPPEQTGQLSQSPMPMQGAIRGAPMMPNTPVVGA